MIVEPLGGPAPEAGERPRWTHLATSSNGSLLGSTDGASLSVIYDANRAAWSGGGFFLTLTGAPGPISSVVFDGVYNNIASQVIRRGASDPACETIVGIVFCGGTSSDFSTSEFFKPGLGATGFVSRSAVSTGLGSAGRRSYVELIASSFTASDGQALAPAKWSLLPSVPAPTLTTPVATGHKGKLFVFEGSSLNIGGSSPRRVEIYDPAANTWTSLPTGLPASVTQVFSATGLTNELVLFVADGAQARALTVTYTPPAGLSVSSGPLAGTFVGGGAVADTRGATADLRNAAIASDDRVVFFDGVQQPDDPQFNGSITLGPVRYQAGISPAFATLGSALARATGGDTAAIIGDDAYTIVTKQLTQTSTGAVRIEPPYIARFSLSGTTISSAGLTEASALAALPPRLMQIGDSTATLTDPQGVAAPIDAQRLLVERRGFAATPLDGSVYVVGGTIPGPTAQGGGNAGTVERFTP